MKKHANLFCVGAALSLLCACESVVKAPEPILPIPEAKQVEWQKKWKHTLLCISV